MQNKHGGAREGAGRKSRPSPKSKGVWLGQITDEQRDFIMQWLSPDERFGVLMAAANKACSRRVQGCGAKKYHSKKKLWLVAHAANAKVGAATL